MVPVIFFPLGTLTFLFQANCMFDAICECYAMYDFARIKCLCIRFTFMVLSFIKSVTFSPMHTFWVYWFNFFLFCFRRYFYLDACPSHRILFFVLGNRDHSCSSHSFFVLTSQLTRCQYIPHE